MHPENSEIKSKLLLYLPFVNNCKRKVSLAYRANQSKMNKLHWDQENQTHCKSLCQTELSITKFRTK